MDVVTATASDVRAVKRARRCARRLETFARLDRGADSGCDCVRISRINARRTEEKDNGGRTAMNSALKDIDIPDGLRLPGGDFRKMAQGIDDALRCPANPKKHKRRMEPTGDH